MTPLAASQAKRAASRLKRRRRAANAVFSGARDILNQPRANHLQKPASVESLFIAHQRHHAPPIMLTGGRPASWLLVVAIAIIKRFANISVCVGWATARRPGKPARGGAQIILAPVNASLTSQASTPRVAARPPTRQSSIGGEIVAMTSSPGRMTGENHRRKPQISPAAGVAQNSRSDRNQAASWESREEAWRGEKSALG